MEDQRRGSRAQPANALSQAEREQIRQLLVSPAYRDLSPKQIVPRLADQLWPGRMLVPSAFMLLDALPLMPNGKVDRRALPAPDRARPELGKAHEDN